MIIPWFGAAFGWRGGSGARRHHEDGARTTREDDARIDDSRPLRARAMGFFGNKWDFLLAGLLIAVALVVILYVQR